MPERFEIYIVYKRRYINTLPFLFYCYIGVAWSVSLSVSVGHVLSSAKMAEPIEMRFGG